MTKYHISKSGNVAVCRAVKGPCRAQAPADLEQFHAEDANSVYDHMARQYNDVMQGIKRPTFSKEFVVTEELIGSEETDTERVSVRHEKESYVGPKIKTSELWLHDTEGRPIDYMKIMEKEESPDKASLCDIEIRPEFRGRKLSHRFMRAVSKNLGKELIHEGGYTPEGMAAIAPFFGRTKDDVYGLYDSMTFVADWDRAWGRWSL